MSPDPHIVRFLDTVVSIEVPPIGPTLMEVDGEWVATGPGMDAILAAWREGATDREPRGFTKVYGGQWDDYVLGDLDPSHADGIRLTTVEFESVHDRRYIPSRAIVYHLEALPFEVEVVAP